MESIRELAEKHLARDGASFGDDIDPATLHDAVAELGFGLEHLTGERALAATRRVLITDRRLLWLATDGRPLSARLDLIAPGPYLPPELARFAAALQLVPPHLRIAPARALVTPLPSDPTGALGALGRTHRGGGAADGRAERLLCMIEASVRRGTAMHPAAGADLASRAVLLDRTIQAGRGSHVSFWLSPLTVADLAHATTRVFGAPRHRWNDPQGFVSLRFSTQGSHLHVRIVPIGAFAGFSLQTTAGASYHARPPSETRRLVRFAHTALHTIEGQILLARVLYGWSAPAEQLLHVSRHTIAERVRDLVGSAADDVAPPAPVQHAARVDYFDEPTESAISADLALTRDERLAAARSAWTKAADAGDGTSMSEAAQGLQHAQAWEEAARAYALVGERFPETRGESAAGAGDCILFSVYARAGVERNDRVKALEAALAWYDSALRWGHPRERLEASYWSACELLLSAHEGHRLRQLEALARYQSTFPDGQHKVDANTRLASLSP